MEAVVTDASPAGAAQPAIPPSWHVSAAAVYQGIDDMAAFAVPRGE
jgi:hypothetical protein